MKELVSNHSEIRRRTVRLKFIDYWWGNRPRYEGDLIYRTLSRHYDVQIDERTPEYVIDGGLGHEYAKAQYEDAIVIATIGENYVPDFNFFDYAIGFDHLEFGDRYLRMPLFSRYREFSRLVDREAHRPRPEELLNRGFCSFVVTNGGKGVDPVRTEIFHALSKYKTVASGGLYMNNVGGRVPDKNAFCAKYKFNIAFENSASPGYTTEKVMQPLTVNSLPIYYGNPFVHDDFTPDCMVTVASRDDLERAVEEVIALDKDDEAYLAKVTAPCLVRPVGWYGEQLEIFLANIVEQPLEQAKRKILYGFQPALRGRLRHLWALDDAWKAPLRAVRRIFK